MPVRVIKSVTGEEILGDVEEVQGGYLVSNPVIVMIRGMPNGGQMGLEFIPYIAYAAVKSVEFALDKVIHILEVDDSVKNQYNTIFGGIVVPPKTLIMG
jgi:hypothetical protein